MPKRVRLADVCEALVDCINRTAPEDPEGPCHAVGTPAMRGNRIDFSQARRISRETYKLWTRRLIPREGDLLLAREAPVGPVVRIPADEPVAAGQRTMHLRPDSSVVDGRYLYYLLISAEVQSRLLGLAMGSTVPHLRVPDVKEFLLPTFHDRDDQTAIAEVLGALDDKIAANDRVITTASRLGKSEFHRAVAEGLQVTIGDVAELVTRGVAPKYTQEDGLLVLNQKCVRDQVVSLGPARLTSTKRSDKVLRRHDVLVNSTGQGTLGRVGRWLEDVEATVDSHITIVRFDRALVDPVCAGFAVMRLERQIETLAEGSTGQTELRRDLLAGLTITVPERPQQAALGQRLATYDALLTQLRHESASLAATRDELLPLLMSGRIRVRDAEKVVEEVV